jgi:OmpA-OmpF porin, OOP family
MKSNIKKRTRTSVVFLITCISMFSCISTFTPESDSNYLGNHLTASGEAINVSKDVNVNGRAIRMNEKINSAYTELKPVFAPHGDKLYFSRSFYPYNTTGEKDPEDIWYSEFDATIGDWSDPVRMSGLLNNGGPNFIENVSATGDTIILGNQYLHRGKMRNGVSYSVNIHGEWIAPKPIIVENDYNMSTHENHFVSLKSGIILLAEQREGTVGDRDLYVSFWNGEYATEPINMGSMLNTDLEEASPFIAADNKTLFFASKGHNGYGGYDIFMSKRLDDTWTNWSTPENLGPAINGPLDEEFLIITHCGRYAIFTKQVEIHNTDLFKISTTDLFNVPILGDISPSNNEILPLSRL